MEPFNIIAGCLTIAGPNSPNQRLSSLLEEILDQSFTFLTCDIGSS